MHPLAHGFAVVVVVVAVLLLVGVGVGVGVAAKSYQPFAEIKVAKQESKMRLRIVGRRRVYLRDFIYSKSDRILI